MNKFDYMAKYGYEQLIYFYDKETGLKGVTCIHDTTLGPALGGTRLWNYATEDEAVEDVLRLASGMTYKNAVAGLNIGGGKTVLIGDADKVKSEAYWRAFGRYVQSLNGRYITAEDVNTSPYDMEYVAMETNYIVGLPKTSGDPSPFTALGVYWAMRASCLEKFGSNDLKGKTVLVQGVGHVGYNLVKLLVEDGAKVYVSDIKKEKLDKVTQDFPAVTIVPTSDIFKIEYDIFAPCAMGEIVNDDTIPQFKCKIICGSANNVLKEERHGVELEKRGILYAPDYVVNAGGVINVYKEILGYDANEAKRKVEKIYGKVLEVFKIAKENNITPAKAADRLAEERIRVIRNIRGNYIKR